MRFVVTGAGGYLGKGIVEELVSQGHEVIALIHNSNSLKGNAAKYICGDVFSCDLEDLDLKHTDCVLHLAWRDGFIHYSESHISDLPKHVEFIERIAKAGAKRVAVMGSMHEVGFYEGSIKAETPCNPKSYYGIAKNALREATAIITQKYNVKMQWIRAFYIVGSDTSGSSLFSKIARASQNGEEDFPFTMGLNQFDFLDYDEFCKQVCAIVSQDYHLGIINACKGRPEKLSDRVERFISENGFNIKLKYGAFPDRPYDSKAVWGDNSIIQEIMGND